MLYEIDVKDAPARFAELMETIAAGYGVLVKQGEDIVARLVPESAFHEDEPDDELTPEERDAKETFELFQSDIEDSFRGGSGLSFRSPAGRGEGEGEGPRPPQGY